MTTPDDSDAGNTASSDDQRSWPPRWRRPAVLIALAVGLVVVSANGLRADRSRHSCRIPAARRRASRYCPTVGDLGTALELLSGASGSFRTVDLTVRHWYDPTPSHREMVRNSLVTRLLGPMSDQQEPPVSEVRKRLWLELPHRMRLEQVVSSGPTEVADPSLVVVDGDNWWMQSERWGVRADSGRPDSGSHTHTGLEDLLDPSAIPTRMDLEVVGRSMQAGRPVLVLRGVDLPRPAGVGYPSSSEHELAVDVERGVVLRTAQRFEGAVVAVKEVLAVAFDELIPAHLFSFDAPEAQLLPRMPRSDSVSIEEAVERAPFVVFVLGDVPDDWTIMGISYSTEAGIPPGQPVVHILYVPPSERMFDGGPFSPLRMEQTTRPHCACGPAPTLVERDGQQFWLSGGSGWGTRIECSRLGTIVSLQCNLPDKRLVDLALSLVPAPGTPPRLVDVVPPGVALLPPEGDRSGAGPATSGEGP